MPTLSPPRALVTGATGFVGQHLVARLLAAKTRVRILTRGGRAIPESWGREVEVIRADLVDAERLAQAVAGCDVVYHLAAELRDVAAMRRVNVEGTRALLAACRAPAVRQVVLLSSVGVMGATRAGCVDERAPCHPAGAYEETKLEAERVALAWAEAHDIALAALRPTIVFGDGPRGAFDSMLAWLRAIRCGRFVWFDRAAVANYVYVADVADACLHAAASGVRGAVIVADSCALTEFVAACARALDVPVPRWQVPRAVGYAAARVMERLLPASPLTTARVRALSSRTRFQSVRVDELGWAPSLGWQQGVTRTVAWYQSQGAL